MVNSNNYKGFLESYQQRNHGKLLKKYKKQTMLRSTSSPSPLLCLVLTLSCPASLAWADVNGIPGDVISTGVKVPASTMLSLPSLMPIEGPVVTSAVGPKSEIESLHTQQDPSKAIASVSNPSKSGLPNLNESNLTLAKAELPETDNLAPARPKDKTRDDEKPLIEAAARSPYATITLAVLALLGLVSIARRHDIG